jgi:hypothetical protein
MRRDLKEARDSAVERYDFDSTDFSRVHQGLWIALLQLWAIDSYLLTARLGEWSVTHRLAVHLGPLFPKWDIDCEFNRDGIVPKRSQDGAIIRPDIIVHQRGKGYANLLAIEAKVCEDISPDDRSKMQEYKAKYHYRWGVCLKLDKSGFLIEWFSKGSSDVYHKDESTWVQPSDNWPLDK